MCMRTYMTMIIAVLPLSPCSQQHNPPATQYLRSAVEHTHTHTRKTLGQPPYSVALWRGESHPWLFPAWKMHLILHSAIRTFIPPSRATFFAFCSEAIQPASSLKQAQQPVISHPVTLSCPMPRCPAAQVHRPGVAMYVVSVLPCTPGHTASSIPFQDGYCLAGLLQWAFWAASRQSLACARRHVPSRLRSDSLPVIGNRQIGDSLGTLTRLRSLRRLTTTPPLPSLQTARLNLKWRSPFPTQSIHSCLRASI